MSKKNNDKKLNKQQMLNKPQKKRKPINIKNILIGVVFVIYISTEIISAIKTSKVTEGEVTIQEIYEMSERGEIDSVNVTKNSNSLYVNTTDGRTLDAVNPQNDTFIYDLMEHGIKVTVQKTSLFDSVTEVLMMMPIVLIMAMFVVYLTNTIIGGSTKMFTLLKPELNHITFDDVKGMGETKEQVQLIVNQMRNWKELGDVGARPVKGALLYGPPGVGKTLLAKAIAKESNVAFISASGADFSEMFVGVGAARVRTLFDLAAANVPCIIFIDEIDCMGKRRKGGDGASQDHNQTLNSLLQKMDGINKFNGIMVIGATNRKDDLDDALLRPGRFDKHYFIGAPTCKKDRDEVVQLYLDRKKMEEEVTLEKVSKLMVGLTGAQIEEALNSSVYVSIQDGRKGIIRLSDVDEAVMQLHAGGVKQKYTSERDEKIAAIHEAGHTIVNLALGMPIAKVSIEPYSGGVGGVTMKDLDILGDNKLKFIKEQMNEVKVFLAGKCAEDIEFGDHSQGCSKDIEQATSMVYEILNTSGLNDSQLVNEIALINMGIQKEVSPEMRKECNEVLEECNRETMKILNEHKKELYNLRDKLLEEKVIVMPTLEELT